MKAITRQKFTVEYREQAVKIITEQGLKISEAACRFAPVWWHTDFESHQKLFFSLAPLFRD
jgi:transposase-like protein